MAIPIEEEGKEYFNEFRCYEHCVFCNVETKFWHNKTNNPVCEKCSKEHKVSELINHFKNKTNE